MSNRVDIDNSNTLNIDSDEFGRIFVPLDVKGTFEETDDSWRLDIDDYSHIRNFEIGSHQIIETHDKLGDAFVKNVKISIKCLKCNFDCIVTSHEREAAIYAWLNRKRCDKIAEKFK